MSFAILGKESLDQLEQMVTSLSFGNIEKKNVARKTWEEGPYAEEQLGVKVEVGFLELLISNDIHEREILRSYGT